MHDGVFLNSPRSRRELQSKNRTKYNDHFCQKNNEVLLFWSQILQNLTERSVLDNYFLKIILSIISRKSCHQGMNSAQ